MWKEDYTFIYNPRLLNNHSRFYADWGRLVSLIMFGLLLWKDWLPLKLLFFDDDDVCPAECWSCLHDCMCSVCGLYNAVAMGWVMQVCGPSPFEILPLEPMSALRKSIFCPPNHISPNSPWVSYVGLSRMEKKKG